MATVAELLNRWLDPVSQPLNPEAARRLVSLHADEEIQRRVDELADRKTEGRLTDQEWVENEALVSAADVVAVLQARARVKIATEPAAA